MNKQIKDQLEDVRDMVYGMIEYNEYRSKQEIRNMRTHAMESIGQGDGSMLDNNDA